MHLNFKAPKLLLLSLDQPVTKNQKPTEDGRSMTTFYYYSVNHQSCLQRNTFSKLSYVFFNTSKCAAYNVISFEVYDGSIGQKILKLWRQESQPFGPGWSANITRIRSWTFRLPWNTLNICCCNWKKRWDSLAYFLYEQQQKV